MISKIPVLPPIFRPVSKMGDVALSADINELYRDVLESSKSYTTLKPDLPPEELAEERLNLYKSVKAAYGLGDPITPEGQSKRLKGAIHQIIGDSPKCYDDQTEVLTRAGWVPWPSVDSDTVFGTVNPDSGQLEYQKASDIIHSRYIGIMVRTETKKIDLLVTPNHHHYAERRIGSMYKKLSGDEQWSKFEKIEAGRFIGATRRVRLLSAPINETPGTTPTFLVNGVTVPADPMAEFLGWWLAEGWYSTSGNQIMICQSKVNPDHVKRIDGLFVEMGLTPDRREYGNGYWWVISDPVFSRWVIDNFGAGAENKKISDPVKEWSPAFLRRLVQGYLYGDGEKSIKSEDPGSNKTFYHRDILTNYGNRSSTVSRTLVDDFMVVGMRIGIGVRLVDTIEHPDEPGVLTQYRFRFDGWNRVLIEYPEQTRWESYDGYVHCATVPNGLLIVRRSGKTAVSGNSGLFQSKVLSKPVDAVGRGVITPDPNLDMDQMGIPEDSAWSLYKDFVMRRLVQQGYPSLRASEMIERKAPEARSALDKEMEHRVIIADRAPTWHKFNLMAFKPYIADGNTIRVCPLVCKGFNADFNGDCVSNPLISYCFDGEFHVDYFSQLVSRLVDGYREELAVKQLGRTTTVLGLEKDRLQVLGIQENGITGMVSVDQVSIHTSHGPTCYTVQTFNGLDGVFSAHHDFLTLGAQCEFTSIKTEDLTKKTLVPYAAGFEIPVSSSRNEEAPTPFDLNFESGFWFGHFLGDGAVTGREDTISHASVDSTTLDYLEAVGSKIVVGVDPWREGNGFSSRWTNKTWALYMKSLGHGAEGKRIQPWMFTASDDFRKGLIAGMLAAEGNASGVVFRMELVSRELLVQLKFLLASYGVVSRIHPGKPAREGKSSTCLPTFVLSINSALVSKLALPWPDIRKCDQFKNVKESSRDTWDIIPFTSEVSELCYVQGKSFSGRNRCKPEHKRDSGVKIPDVKQMRVSREQGFCTRAFAKKIVIGYGLDRLPDSEVAKNWTALVNNDSIRWDRIVTHEKSDRPEVMYDMSVPGFQAFAIDGPYLTHNCMNFHVPASHKANEQAKSKMLPSSNLISLTDLRSVRYSPAMEMTAGLYSLTKEPSKKQVKVFRNEKEARDAYRAGTIAANDPVEILGR